MSLNLTQQKLLSSAIVRCPFLTEGAKITFLCLISLRSNQVSISEIALARGKNDSTIQFHIKELKKQKYIEVSGKGGVKNSTSVYDFLPENIFKSMGFSPKLCRGIMGGNGHAIKEASCLMSDPDFLFDLTKKLIDKKIKLPNSNEHVRFLNKHRGDYNRGDVVKYYRCAYKNRVGVPHRVANKRDLNLCSRLLNKYTPTILCKVIDTALSKRGDLAFLTFEVFHRNADRYFRLMPKRKQGSSNFSKPKKKKTNRKESKWK